MPEDAIDISLNGREYRVACPPEERQALIDAATYLDEQLRKLAAKTGAAGEKLAVMTALNITHEFIAFQRSGGFDMPDLKRRIGAITARLDEAIDSQERLF
ncbi:MAG: cell division protein ZapA [Pseudazoarcus pumilus]|nr:cell division protein ZapA [Pseudazoarcus pumilus]